MIRVWTGIGFRPLLTLDDWRRPSNQPQEEPRRTKLPASMLSPRLVRKHMRRLRARQRQREAAMQKSTAPTREAHAVTKPSTNRGVVGQGKARSAFVTLHERKHHKCGMRKFVRAFARRLA